MWGWNSLETLWRDLRYAIRQLRLSPVFALVRWPNTSNLPMAAGKTPVCAVLAACRAG